MGRGADRDGEGSSPQGVVERLRAVAAVAECAAGAVDLQQVFTVALDSLAETTGLEVGLVFLADRDTGELSLSAHRGILELSAASLRCVPVGEGLVHRVFRSAGPVVVRDLSAEIPTLAREGVQTAVLAPLRSNDSAQGIMAVGCRAAHRPDLDDLQLMTIVADLVGVVVDNAHLHREADRKLQVHTHLNELAERILSEFELDAIMPMVLGSAQHLTGADGAGVALGDANGAQGYCSFSLPAEPGAQPVQPERVVHGEVSRIRRPLIIEDYPSYEGAVAPLIAAGLASLIAVPIVYGDHMFGTLTLFSFDRSRRYTPFDVAVAVELGSQTGIALENARLYQSTRFYVRQVTRAQEDERKRIARELHDETIQNLVVISRRLESLSLLADQLPPAAQERIATLQELLGETMRGVRRFVHDLRPPTLDHLGLVASVEALASDLRVNSGIETTVQVVGDSRRLEPEEELVLFRIVQEALGNARRHSGATKVEVHLDFGADQVRVSVSDNGSGFEVPGRIDDFVSQQKLGVIGMQERARTLGGDLAIRSYPGRGTKVTVVIPSHPAVEVEPNQTTCYEARAGSGG